MNHFQHRFVRVCAVALLPIMVITLLLTSARASAATTVTFTPVADSYVSTSYPGTNYGTSTALRVDGSPDVHSYLRFTVSGLNGQMISHASLELYSNASNSAGLTAKTVSNNTWGETTITYSNMPALGSTLGNSGSISGAGTVTLDVSSYVTAEGTYSFGVITPGSIGFSFGSRESTHPPKLVLTLGGTVSTATPTGKSSPTPTPSGRSSPTPTPTGVSASGSIRHIFLIVMENHGYSQVWNTSSSPYITSLGNQYVRATNFYSITHPSLPDYLDMYAGSNYGITTDCSPSSSCHVNARNLADNLDAAGLTWKGYMESMPSPCYLTTSGGYAPKHNPFVYFDDIRTNSTRCDSHVVNFSALSGDLSSASTTPDYAFITPNGCDDMHDCSVSTGDTWLKNHVPAILNSPACTSQKCLVVVTWDEDNGNYSNHVLTIFAGSGAKTGGVTSGTHYTLFSLLRTVEDIFGLPTQTSNDAAASPMSDMLR